MQQQKEHDRKARTKRLIERGAILESLIGNAEALSNEEIKALLQTVLASAPASEKSRNTIQRSDTGESLA